MNSVKILDIRVDNINFKNTLDTIDKLIKDKRPSQICTVNPEYIMNAQDDPELKHIINNSRLNLADGGGLLFAANYTSQNLKHRVTGVDLVDKLCSISNKKKYKIFFLGGENGSGFKAAKIIKSRYPGCKIVGINEGYPNIKPISKKVWLSNYKIKKSFDFRKNPLLTKNNQKIISEITAQKPDILFVALGCPKQDKFIARFAHYMQVPVMIGVGGSFDFISGQATRAPKFFRTLRIEWLFRLIMNPRKRLSRIYTAVIKFPWTVFINSIKE